MFEIINYRQHPRRGINEYLAIVLKGEYPMVPENLTWVVSLDKVNSRSSIEEVVHHATLLLAFDHLFPTSVASLFGRITQQQFVDIAMRSEPHIYRVTKQDYPTLFTFD